jgi:hypothetical protein
MILGYLRTATPAERVRLIVALSEAGSSLRCLAVSLDVRRIVTACGAAYSLWIRNCAQIMSAIDIYCRRIRKAYLVTLWWVSDGGVWLGVRDRISRLAKPPLSLALPKKTR